MSDYSAIGYDSKLRKIGSLATRPREYQSVLKQQTTMEVNPYAAPYLESKGTIMARGKFTIVDGNGNAILNFTPGSALTMAGSVSMGTVTADNLTTSGSISSGGITSEGTITLIDNGFLFLTTTPDDGNVGLRMKNFAGNEVLTMGVDSDGFGHGTINEINFASNPDNKLIEQFGVVAHLADGIGVHALRVQNVDGVEKFALTSKGFMEIKGTIADPGGAGAGVARLFVQNSGGKDQLRVEFNTGTSQVIATEP